MSVSDLKSGYGSGLRMKKRESRGKRESQGQLEKEQERARESKSGKMFWKLQRK